MAFVKKFSDGEYYLCRYPMGSSNKCGIREQKKYRNWYLIKSNKGAGFLGVTGIVTLPKEFIGKKVRLKVEIMEERKWKKMIKK